MTSLNLLEIRKYFRKAEAQDSVPITPGISGVWNSFTPCMG